MYRYIAELMYENASLLRKLFKSHIKAETTGEGRPPTAAHHARQEEAKGQGGQGGQSVDLIHCAYFLNTPDSTPSC
jgi:hypothetical protein